MREIDSALITKTVKELFLKANVILPKDTEEKICSACEREASPVSAAALRTAKENLIAAKTEKMPICQDTGMAVVFCEIGKDIHIVGDTLTDAVNEGVRQAYTEGFFRCSIVDDPLFNRKNTSDNTPAVIHTEFVNGDRLKITVEPKGFGSENMSKIKMFNPSITKDDIIKFAVQTVKEAGGNPCPPVVLGIGIGGTFDYSAVLAKKALARSISVRNANPLYAALEEEILDELNKTGVGAQGFGGDTTALAVNIEYFPTHIAGLPVAINVNCHIARHAETLI